MRYVSIDIETTGLDPQENDIIEFGAVLDDLSSSTPIKMLPRFHCYFVRPFYNGSPFALSMHPKIFRRIADRESGYTYISATKLGHRFQNFLLKNGYKKDHDKICITAAGKNFGAFDLQFLKFKTDFLKHVEVRHRILDPAVLYLERGDAVIPGTSECKSRANLEKNVAHTAIEDAIDVIKLLRCKLSEKFSS